MITNFEDYTFELTDSEKKALSFIVGYFKFASITKNFPRKNKDVCRFLENHHKIKCTTPRMRKIIHEIRAKGIIPNLLASSKGYYISEDLNELEAYFESLDQRINSIKEIQDQIAHVIRNLKKDVAE